MNAYDIATQFDEARVEDTEGNVVYANVWTPEGKNWSRIYFSTSRKKNAGKDYGYVFVGNDVDYSSLRGGCDAIRTTLDDIIGQTDGGGGEEQCPF